MPDKSHPADSMIRSQLVLGEAKRTILDRCVASTPEQVSLGRAFGRVPSINLCALNPQPGFDQSTFDGYVISRQFPQKRRDFFQYRLVGEIPAGDTEEKRLFAGDSYHIMTGGALPKGGWMVLPQEICREKDGVVTVDPLLMEKSSVNIRKMGSVQKVGSCVAPAGVALTAAQVGRLADTGHSSVTVHSRPRVSFFCTGSELVDNPNIQQKGLKVSSNRYLLDGLIRNFGGVCDDRGSVIDSMADMCAHLQDIIDNSSADIIISTGGMGPGKYDMLTTAFAHVGGEIIFTSLQLRPGKSTLFGLVGGKLYFGLPGPPKAVKALFHELVRPALLRIQGLKQAGSDVVKAYLEEDLVVGKRGVLKLYEAMLFLNKGKCCVRLASNREVANSYLLCPGHRKILSKGELVTVHSLQPPV